MDRSITEIEPFPRLLMQNQMLPFNGDKFIEYEFLKLKRSFDITVVIETGCCLGSTTLWFAEYFNKVISTEVNNEFAHYAIKRLRHSVFHNWEIITQKSENCLAEVIDKVKEENIIFFLDAHWGANCPLEKELEIIAESKIKPVIAIHDFKVPNESLLGYDSYNGQDFTFEWLKPRFDAIYGEGNYNYHFNNSEQTEGAKRGIIYLYQRQYEIQ